VVAVGGAGVKAGQGTRKEHDMTTDTLTAPLVRTRFGAVLGIDYRRTDLSPVTVPGQVRAQHVMPGDTILVGEDRYVVHAVRNADGDRRIITESAGGAPVVFEWRAEGLVDVVAVGAFDR